MQRIVLDGNHLSIGDVIEVACKDAWVDLSVIALEEVRKSRDFIIRKVDIGEIAYGVTTGFGPNADQTIRQEDAVELQRNLLLSHAGGVGDPFSVEISRAVMLIRLNTLLCGHSGVRVETVRLLQTFLNYRIHPVIPQQGSVGASGDLCPLAHMALPMIGEGFVFWEGGIHPTAYVLGSDKIDSLNIQFEELNESLENNPFHPDYQQALIPLTLSYKEGLALNNGTTLMCALGAIAVHEAYKTLDLSILASCLTFEAICARVDAFNPWIANVRRHEGQFEVLAKINRCIEGSELIGIWPREFLQTLRRDLFVSNPDFNSLRKAVRQKIAETQKNLERVEESGVKEKLGEKIVQMEPWLAVEDIAEFFKPEALFLLMRYIPGDFLNFLNKNLLEESDEQGNEPPAWKSWRRILSITRDKLIPQDAYSIRCTPQVLGASHTAIRHVEQVIQNELNAVVDNPIIFVKGQELDDLVKETVGYDDVLSGGNFHGQPIALVLDYLKLALSEIGNFMERQINKMMDKSTNHGLPAFLSEQPGLHSGLMITQYVAAGLASENKVLVHPASADSIPTSANQEDHVSMGPIAGRQALEINGNVRKILAIAFITGAQALELRQMQLAYAGLHPSPAAKTKATFDRVRQFVPYLKKDRFLQPDIQKVIDNLDNMLDILREN